MSDRLRAALSANRAEIRAGLEEAKAQLAKLEARRQELMELIASGRAALGEQESMGPEPRPITLHKEMLKIIAGNGDQGMKAAVIAIEVNRRGNYRKRDSSDVQSNQIHARVNNYGNLFEKRNSLIFRRVDGG